MNTILELTNFINQFVYYIQIKNLIFYAESIDYIRSVSRGNANPALASRSSASDISSLRETRRGSIVCFCG